MDRNDMGLAFSSIVEKTTNNERSVEDLLLLYHKRLGHPSFLTLSRLYPALFENANKEKLGCDACELGKHTRSSYASSGNRSSCSFELIYSDVWGPCPTNTINGFKYCLFH